MDARERFALTSYTDLLREGHDPDSAQSFLTHEVGMDPELVNRAVQLYDDLARGVREMREPRVLYDGTRVPQPWYSGPSPKDVFWPSLEQHLQSKPGWNGTPLESLDRSSSKVVSYLEPPYAREIRTRGLVVGYIQSGKTSNFTAVISKAADAGYRLFIVLSGLHNNLRRQTQLRLNEQLVDLNRELWVPLTSLDQDFGNPLPATPLLAQPALRLLAVAKKHGLRLRNLISWLDRAKGAGVLDHCPILVVDDEADQASPNTKKAAQERAVINGLIIKLLEYPRVAYVGYTATPFANFFIDPQYPEDLYPRHFIVDLPRSDDYFGPETLFGREPRTSEEAEPETLDMVRDVKLHELDHLVPPRGGHTFAPSVTPSLRAAIRWFLLAATARRLRDGEPRHTTMLIHTSERVAAHDLLWQPVVDEIRGVDSRLSKHDATITGELSDQWSQEVSRVDPMIWGHKILPPAQIVGGIRQTIALLGNLADRTADDCGVVVDNSFSPKRLIYDEENPLPVVVIGGNTLSRGLTLEGLVSSFFVRSAGTYDTLLQMGRWFGYRRGYEDLTRMWTTTHLRRQFRLLAGVEEQIREEIARYEDEGLIPAQVPVRVQTIPGLAITSPTKMYATHDLKMSYSGQRPQTILFNTEPTWLEKNLEAARGLIRSALAEGVLEDRDNRIVIRDVPSEKVLEFVDGGEQRYSFHENNAELQSDTLAGYIRSQNDLGALETWNVAVVSRLDNAFGRIDLGFDRTVNMIGRSKLKDASTDDTANIGILTNQVDWVADLDVPNPAGMSLTELKEARTDSGRAVVLLYPIARNSPAKTAKGQSRNDKVDLGLDVDVMGVAFAFPKAPSNPTPQNYKVVRLPHQLTPDLGDEVAEEEAEEIDDEFVKATGNDDGEGSFDDVEAHSP